MLVFGVVFESALVAVWPGFRFDFNGFWEDLGEVLGRFGRNLRTFWVILGLCKLFWAVFWADLRKILAGAPCCNGIHFELKLLLALLLVFAFFCLLWLAWAGFGLLWLLWLLGLKFLSCWAHFSLMWLRLSLLNLLSFFSLLSLLDYQICNWF